MLTSSDVFFIAEAGSNWRISNNTSKNLREARRLIEVAAEAQANACKFQVFTSENTYAPNAGNYKTYGNINRLFSDLSLPAEWLPELKAACNKAGLEFMASVFSIEDMRLVDPFVNKHKVASYEINHMELLEELNLTQKEVFISSGAASYSDVLRATGAVTSAVIMHCTAAYPALTDQVNLGAIKDLAVLGPVGYSDHTEFNTIVPSMAVALGVCAYEKHFTLNKSAKGPDHKFALSPKELKETIQVIRQAEAAKGDGCKYTLACEEELAAYAVRHIQAKVDIEKGSTMSTASIGCLRPGNNTPGESAHLLRFMLGKRVKKDIRAGEGITLQDIIT